MAGTRRRSGCRRSAWTPTSASAPTAASRRSASATCRRPGSMRRARSIPASGNAYASYLLGELNATTVVEDSEVATSGRFYTYAFWAQDDFKLRPNLSLNLGLRYDIMKPYTELYDRWSFMDATLPNPAVSGYPGAVVFAGDGPNSCHCRTPIKTYYGAVGPRLGLAYTLNDRTVLRTSYGINYSRRAAVGGRAGARNGTGMLGFSANASFPSPNASFAPAYNWNDGVPGYPPPPFFDPSLNAGFVTGRASGGSVTYGDPDIGGRMPRYQNWNAGFQYALHRTITVGASYAGSRGDFLDGSGARLLFESARSEIPRAGQPADSAGNGRQPRSGAGDCPGHRPSLREFLGHDRADAASVSAVLGGDRCLRERRAVDLQFAAADGRKAPIRRRVVGLVQLHVQPDGRQSRPRGRATTSSRTGLSARTISRTSGTRSSSTTCRLAQRAEPAAAIRSSARSSRTGRCRASRSSDRDVRSDRSARRAICRTQAGVTRISTRTSAAPCASTAITATAMC